MSEKRFTIKEIDNFSYGIKVTDVIMDNHIELPQSTACDLLNELHEENQDLHKKEVELGQNYLRLLEENEWLKHELLCK